MKSKKDNPELVTEFQNPLQNISPIYISNRSNAEEILSEIELKLKNQDDWSVRSEGIQLALSALKGGITQNSSTDYSSFCIDIANCVTDLRSALVKSGSLLIAASAQIFQEKYGTSIKVLIPSLFKQLTHGTAIISNSCRLALLEIARNVPITKTYYLFNSKIQSKNNQHRLMLAEMINILLETWPSTIISTLNDSLNSSLQTLIDDASQDVRKTARKALLLFRSKNNENSMYSKDSIRKSITPNRKPTFSLSSRKNTHTPKTPSFSQASSIKKVAPKPKKIRSFSPIKNNSKPARPNSANSLKTNEKSTAKQTPTNNNRQSNQNIGSEPSDKNRGNRTPLKQPKQKFVTPQLRKDQKVKFVEITDELPNSKKNKNEFSFTLPTIPPKGILKRTNFKNVIRKSELESYMPPKTMNDAVLLQQLLIDIFDTEIYDQLNGFEELLVPSIVICAQFIPSIDEWDSVILAMFELYCDYVKINILDLLIAFRCDSWLIRISCEKLGFEYLADLFMKSTNQKYIKRFFCRVSQLNLPVQISEELKQFLEELVYNNSDCEDIQTLLDNSEPEYAALVDDSIESLKNGVDYVENAMKLESFLNDSPFLADKIGAELQEDLIFILQNGTNEEKNCLYEFMLNIPSLSFSFLSEVLLSMPNDDITRDYIIEFMKNKDFFLSVLDYLVIQIETESEMLGTTLSLLLTFFQNASDHVVNDVIEETFEQLLPMLESCVTALRRTVVLILVEIKCKVPDSYEYFSEKIPTKHQKLIELYASRRKARPA